MKKLAASLLTLASLGLFAPAQSATLDLTGVGAGITGGPDINLPLATIHSDGIALYNTIRPSGAALCGFTLQMDCRADMKVSFVLPFVGVSFLATGWNDGDAVTVHAFNGLVDIGTRAIGGNGIFDLSSLGTITSLLFDDASSEDGGGMSFGNFVINLAASGPPDLGSDVPLPAALPLLMAGIGALGGLRTLKRG